ncbi:MAG: hypothetical protein Q9222_000211 [Ikaeria aurantiellina]
MAQSFASLIEKTTINHYLWPTVLLACSTWYNHSSGEIANLQKDITDIKGSIGTVKKTVGDVEKSVGNIKKSVTTMKEDILSMKPRITATESKLAMLSEAQSSPEPPDKISTSAS